MIEKHLPLSVDFPAVFLECSVLSFNVHFQEEQGCAVGGVEVFVGQLIPGYQVVVVSGEKEMFLLDNMYIVFYINLMEGIIDNYTLIKKQLGQEFQ